MVGQSVCVSHCALLCTLELISDHGAMREWPWILNVLYVCRISRVNRVLGKLLTVFMRQFNFEEVSRLNWHANCILRKKFDTFNAPIYWRRSAYSQTWRPYYLTWPKVIQIIRPWKNWRDLKKLTFNILLLH